MTKRPHPDGSSADNSPLQLKTRVGQRQVNEGVMAEENMKKVYDKTLGLLQAGAREAAKAEKEGEKEEPVQEKEENEEEVKVTPGQTYLNSKGEVAGVYRAVPLDKEENKNGDAKKEKEAKDGEGNMEEESKDKDGEEKMEEDNKKDDNGLAEEIEEDQTALEKFGFTVKECDDSCKNAEEKMDEDESKKEDNKTDEGEKEEEQTALEKFGFKIKDSTPVKGSRPSPNKSPIKSPYKLEKRPLLKLDQKMEEDSKKDDRLAVQDEEMEEDQTALEKFGFTVKECDDSCENAEEKMEEDSKKEDNKTDEGEKEEEQTSLEKFGFKVKDSTPDKGSCPSPNKSPIKSPNKLEKTPLNVDEKMEEAADK